MKTLYLMRHAQAESHGPLGDRSRPLTPGGRADAEEVGRMLQERDVQLALVSSAVRTRETFEALGLDCRAEFQDVLYSAGTEELLQRIGEIEDEVVGLLVVGHSPTIPALAAELLARSAPREADQLRCHYPTSTLTVLRTEGSWEELGEHPVTLEDVLRRQ